MNSISKRVVKEIHKSFLKDVLNENCVVGMCGWLAL